MALTKAQIKQAQTALTKKVAEHYTKEELETLQWYTDVEDPNGDFYRWRFLFPEDGKKRIFTYMFKTKSVVIRRVD